MSKRLLTRLTAAQTFQLNLAMQARIKEFAEKNWNQARAAKELSEGLGFTVSLSAIQTALTATGLLWPRAVRVADTSGLKSRDILEALVRDHLRICEQLGVEASATLKKFYLGREASRHGEKSPAAQEGAKS